MKIEKNAQDKSTLDSENKYINKTSGLANDPSQQKTFLYQKWWFWLIIAIILLFSFSRFENNDKKDKSNIGTAHIVIESFRLSENYGDPVIIVKYQYTNYDNEPRSFMYSVSTKAYQDGIELNTPYIIDDETNYHFKDKSTDVSPGITTTVEIAYELRNLSSDVTIVLTNFLEIGNDCIRRTFDIKDIAEEVLGNKDSEGYLGDIYIKIDSFRITESFNDKLIIVKYIFTNNSEESTSFSYSVSDTAYQNGIGLDEAYFVSGSANYSSENQSVKIQPGITLEVEVAYELKDENSDVFIELSKYSGRKITKTFTLN